MIKWIKVDYGNGGFMSAAASIDHGYRQWMADTMVAQASVIEHIDSCKECYFKTEEDNHICKKLESMLKEIAKRLSAHEDFFKNIETLKSISEWYRPPPNEPSVMHDINDVIGFYEDVKK